MENTNKFNKIRDIQTARKVRFSANNDYSGHFGSSSKHNQNNEYSKPAHVIPVNIIKKKALEKNFCFRESLLFAAKKTFNSIISLNTETILNFKSEYQLLNKPKSTDLFKSNNKVHMSYKLKQQNILCDHIDNMLQTLILFSPKQIPKELLDQGHLNQCAMDCIDMSFKNIKNSLYQTATTEITVDLNIMISNKVTDFVSKSLLFDLFVEHKQIIMDRLKSIGFNDIIKLAQNNTNDVGFNNIKIEHVNITIYHLDVMQDYILKILELNHPDFEYIENTRNKKLRDEYLSNSKQLAELKLLKSKYNR